MGLTIHYGLSSRVRSSERARKLVEKLRQKALVLPFAECSKLYHLTGQQADFNKVPRGPKATPEHETLSWLLIQAHSFDNEYENIPVEVIAFSTWPGEGCEAANFGLCRYRQKETGKLSNWRWGSFCKTQYASEVSVEHFLKCHLLVCAMLETAQQLGFTIEVDDEGDFWQKRDLKALAKEVGEWNTMVAAYVGALEDAMGGPAGVAPIKDMPDYEHLEAKGRDGRPDLDEKARALAAIVAQMTSRKCG